MAKNKATDFCEHLGISTEKWVRRRRMPGKNAADTGLLWQEVIKREQLEILDRLHKEIISPTQQTKDINAKFGFLAIDFLLDPANNRVYILTNAYNEIIASDLEQEFCHLRRLLI